MQNWIMMILSVEGLTKSYSGNDLFSDVSFFVNKGEKVALIGANGSGKTTLFKILQGRLSYDDGLINIPPDVKLGYFDQHIDTHITQSLYQFVDEVFRDIHELEARIRYLELQMTSDLSETLINEYANLREIFEKKDGFSVHSRIVGVLTGLGFSKSEFEKPLCEMSGGQKNRAGIARLLLTEPDIIFLDEPTNHLDLDGIVWLEKYIESYKGTVFIISHDRYFLEKTCTKTLELEGGELSVYNHPYTMAMAQKKLEFESQLRAFEKQQREITRQESIIRTLKQRGNEIFVKRAKSREKLLESLERIKRPQEFKSHFRLKLDAGYKGGYEVMKAKNISFSYHATPIESANLLDNIEFEIYFGDRIGLIGANGTGKTTLLKLITKQLEPISGELTYGRATKIGYFEQEHTQLDPRQTVLESIYETQPLTMNETKGLLGSFMFRGDDLQKKIENLSGGEKSRIALLKLMLSPANLMLLDEPTNHLDISAKEIIEEALSDYQGSFITISHDRYFLSSVCNKIWYLKDKKLKVYNCGYDEFVEKISREENNEPEISTIEPTTKTQLIKDRKQKKIEEKELRDQKKKLKDLENSIEALETEISILELKLCEEEVYSDYELANSISNEINAKKFEVAKMYEQLERLW